MTVLTLADWLRGAAPEEREMLAGTIDTSVNYLYHLAGGHGRPSLGLLGRIVQASTAFATPDESGVTIGPGAVDALSFHD